MFLFYVSYDGTPPCRLHLALIAGVGNSSRCLIRLFGAGSVDYVLQQHVLHAGNGNTLKLEISYMRNREGGEREVRGRDMRRDDIG